MKVTHAELVEWNARFVILAERMVRSERVLARWQGRAAALFRGPLFWNGWLCLQNRPYLWKLSASRKDGRVRFASVCLLYFSAGVFIPEWLGEQLHRQMSRLRRREGPHQAGDVRVPGPGVV